MMLDLRSIAAENEEYKWYPLARSKYKTHKPQIRLLLAIEEESAQPPAEPHVSDWRVSVRHAD